MGKKFKKHVVILAGCQVLYLKKKDIDKFTYNGSQLNYDMVVSLANNNPDIKYYVLSGCVAARTNNRVNDKKREEAHQLLESIFKYYDRDPENSNIEFIVENKYRFEGDDTADPIKLKTKLDGLVNELMLKGIDYGIVKGGMFNGHIPYWTPKISKKVGQFDEKGNVIRAGKAATVENNTTYSLYVLNNLLDRNGEKLKYITINDDDNFCGLRKADGINLNVTIPEVANINMYNGFNDYELYSSLDPYVVKYTNDGIIDWKRYKVPVLFKEGMDTILLKSDTMKNLDISNTNRNGIFMYMNFREKNNIRYQRFEDYILNNEFNCDKKLWTNLKEFKAEEYKNGYFKQFNCDIEHQPEGHKTTMEELCKAKYTLCISVFKTQQCIGRFWEAVYCGVIPFVQRQTNSNGDLIDGIGSKEWKEMYSIPDFLFVETPSELAEKINLLESNNELYLQVLNDVKKILKPEYLDKNQINKIIIETVNQYIK